jgi:hypothetical protein
MATVGVHARSQQPRALLMRALPLRRFILHTFFDCFGYDRLIILEARQARYQCRHNFRCCAS